MASDPYAPDPSSTRTGVPAMAESLFLRPHSAMVWNLAGGGKDNFPPDRELFYQFDQIDEGAHQRMFSQLVQANAAFVARVVAELHAEKVTQFIDLGPGIPAEHTIHDPTHPDSLYGNVLSANADAKIVYVDNDPIVLAKTYGFRDQPGQVLILEGDIFEPSTILANPVLNDFLDWTRPIGLICTAVLHEHPGPVDEITSIMAAYVDRLPPGSYTAISHFLDTEDEYTESIIRPLEKELIGSPIGGWFRTLQEIEALFPGQQIQDPGVEQCRRWRNPDYDDEAEGWDGRGIAGGIGRVSGIAKLS